MEPLSFRGRAGSLFLKVPIWMASVSLNLMALIMPIVILLIFDRVIPFQSLDTLRMLTLIMIVATSVEFCLRWSRMTLLNVASERAAVTNYHRFASKVLHADTEHFLRDAPSTYGDRFNAISQLRDHNAGNNHALLIDLPFTLVFAVAIALIGGWLAAVPLAGFCVILLVSFVMKRGQWALFDRRKTLDNHRYAFLSEVLSGIRTVKSNRMEQQMSRRFELMENQTVDVSQRLIRFSGMAQNFGAVFGQVSVAAMGLLGAYLVITQKIGMAEMAACMLLNGRIIQPLTKLMSLWVQSESVAASWRKLHEIDDLSSALPTGTAMKPVQGRITIENLVLRKAGQETEAKRLERIRVLPGQVMLVKSKSRTQIQSLYDAILGQDTSCAARVLIDHLPTKSRVHKRGLHAIVALEKDPAILSGTLLENLSAFGDETQINDAKNIARALGLEKRIHRLSTGYNTELGQSASVFEMDPVNRQLIALVRVLALRPKILIMSEPTAILDTPEREALSTYISSLDPKPTIVMDSPDPRMKRLADVELDFDAAEEDMQAWYADAQADHLYHNQQENVA